MSTSERLLTTETTDAIRAYFPRYPNKQAVVLPALHLVQETLGYVPPQAVVEVAELLELFVLQTLSMRFLQTHHLSGV